MFLTFKDRPDFYIERASRLARALALAGSAFPFRKLDASDCAMYRAYQPETTISCRSFLSQYAYTEEDCIRVFEDSESGCLLAIYMDEENRLRAYPPLGARSGDAFSLGVERLLRFFEQVDEEAVFGCVEEDELSYFRTLGGFDMQTDAFEREDDYVYATADLIDFSGGENANRRSSRSKFLRRHALEFELNKEIRPEEYDFISAGWCDVRDCAECGYRCPRKTMLRALAVSEAIGAHVFLMRMDGSPEAVLVTGSMGGEQEDLLSICNRTRLEGLTYAFIERACIDAFPDARYLNLEEDLGLPMLKHFKRLLKPARTVRKYYVRLTVK